MSGLTVETRALNEELAKLAPSIIELAVWRLLLLVGPDGTHGYEIGKALLVDPGRIYRILRQLAGIGWAIQLPQAQGGQSRGPARRCYTLTALGTTRLRELLQAARQVLECDDMGE